MLNKQDIINRVGDKFFTVDFVKKNGEKRTMNCRLGVTKHLRGGNSTTAHYDNLLTVYDMKIHGYRTVNIETLQRITVDNETITFNNEVGA